MIEVRTEINRILRTIHPKVYFQRASSTAEYPYIVYDLPNSFTNEEQDIFNLDVDIWDNNIDTTELETLSGAIWNELNRYRHLDENIQFSIYRMNRLALNEDDSSIRRRKLIFELRYYDRRNK